MPVKLSLIFNVTTEAVNPSWSTPHSGGWTEGFWTPESTAIPAVIENALATVRSPLLPKQAAIIGFRQQIYTLSGNKILPGGTAARKALYVGNASYNLNLPQDALEITGRSSTSINTNRMKLRALPDEVVDRGEYSPTGPFATSVAAYRAYLIQSPYWSFVGRVLSNPTRRVLTVSYAGGGVAELTVDAAFGASPVGGYLRFNRVYGVGGQPISGAFLVTAFTAPNKYTLAGYPGYLVLEPSGLVRLDEVALYPIGSTNVGRAVIAKIGRPSSSYRGRRSSRVEV